MHLRISMVSEKPIYEQLKEQIKHHIIKATLEPHTQMPSVRVLSKELKIGIITVKRAYDELVIEGYLYVKAAVGYFSAEVDKVAHQKATIKTIEKHIDAIKALMQEADILEEVIIKLLKDRGTKDE